MISLPFDVNQPQIRRQFLKHYLFDALAYLKDSSRCLWGNMVPQQMIEHLIWAFGISWGRIDVQCHVPVNRRQHIKRFLYNEEPNPRNFQNPALAEGLPDLQFNSLGEAKNVLRDEVNHFFEYYNTNTNAEHVHPLFGLMGAEDWERLHYKHVYHHLLQFGLVEETPKGAA